MAIFKVTAKPDFTELKNAISGLESTPIKIDIDTTPVIAKIKATSQNLSKMTQTFDGGGRLTGAVQQYNSKLGETVQVTRRLNKETGELEVTQEKVTQNYEKVAKAAERAAQIQAKAQAAAQKAQEAEANRAVAEAQKIQNVLGSLGTNIGTFSGNAAEAKQWIASLDGMSGATVKATGNVRNAAGVFQTYSAAVDGAKGTTDNFTFAINESTGEVDKLSNGAVDAAKKSSLLGDSLGRVLLKMAAWQVFGDMISKVIGSFREAINTLKDVDTEMVNVQKVTDYSKEQMEELEENAYALASAYGRTADEITAMYTTFARAGFLGDQLDSMTELGTLLANIGDISQDTASKFLLAVDAAWKLNGSESELMTIMDGLNEITNKNAVDMEALTSGITVAGSVFSEAGESVQTFSALVGAGVAATQRSGSEISRALRTIVMNIRQIKGETEDGELIDGESIAKASNALREYAGISTMANGQLRLSSDVLKDLAGKWNSLDTVAQSAISEALAGKRQANVLSALMGNWETVEKMMSDYADGVGSALRENEIYMDSWEAKSKKLKATWTEFVSHLVETDTIKGALDGVIGLVEFLDSDTGRLVVQMGLLVGTLALLNKGFTSLMTKTAVGTFFGTLTSAIGGNAMAITQLTGQMKSLVAMLPKIGIGAAIFAALAAAIYIGTQKQREYNNALQETEAIQSELGETQSEYDALINKTEELTSEEKKRLEVLKELRKEQEKQLDTAKKTAWEAWNKLYGSGAQSIVGGGEGVGGGLGAGALETERMDIVALRNYREELAGIAAQYQIGEMSAGAYYDALEKLNAAREDSVETIRAAIDAGYEVTEEQRQLVAAYDRVQQTLGVAQNATKDYVSKLIEEAQQSGATGKALYDLVAAQIAASNQGLNFSQQIAALQQLGYQAGLTAQQVAKATGMLGTYQDQRNIERTIKGLMQIEGLTRAQAEARVYASMQHALWTGISQNGGWGGTSYTPSSSSYYVPSGGGNSGSSAKSKQNALDNAKKKAAQATIDAIRKQMKAETDAIDEQISALKKQNEEQERSKKLEELKLEILKKQDLLLNARNERTVRQYNAATGQWEWVANPEKVRQAQEDLENAKKELREYEADVEREIAIAELEARKKNIEAGYQLKIDSWQKFIDQLNGDVETERALLAASLGNWQQYYQEMLAVYQNQLNAAKDYQAQMNAIQQQTPTPTPTPSPGGSGHETSSNGWVQDRINKGDSLSEANRSWSNLYVSPGGTRPSGSNNMGIGTGTIMYMQKWYGVNQDGKWGRNSYDAAGGRDAQRAMTLWQNFAEKYGSYSRFRSATGFYDEGGILTGVGGIKATPAAEIVVPPKMAARMLAPAASRVFKERMDELGFLYGANDAVPRSFASRMQSTDSHNVSTQYIVNGATIGSDAANSMTMAQVIHGLVEQSYHLKQYGN